MFLRRIQWAGALGKKLTTESTEGTEKNGEKQTGAEPPFFSVPSLLSVVSLLL